MPRVARFQAVIRAQYKLLGQLKSSLALLNSRLSKPGFSRPFKLQLLARRKQLIRQIAYLSGQIAASKTRMNRKMGPKLPMGYPRGLYAMARPYF